MEFLRKTKLDADLPTKTKKGEEEAEVGEKKGKVHRPCREEKGQRREKEKGRGGVENRKKPSLHPTWAPLQVIWHLRSSVLDASTLHLLPASQLFSFTKFSRHTGLLPLSQSWPGPSHPKVLSYTVYSFGLKCSSLSPLSPYIPS